MVREARAKLPTYRDILEISDRVKKGEAKSSTGASFSGYKKPGNFSIEKDVKDVEYYKCHKNGNDANKCPQIKAKDSKGAFKVRKVNPIRSQVGGEHKLSRSVEKPIGRVWIRFKCKT